MPITLTQAQRKTISLQVLDLPVIVQSSQNAQSQLEAVRDDLLINDSDIKIFYDFFNDIVNSYQTERRWLDGTTYTQVQESQIESSARREDGNLYFPATESFAWANYTPYVDSTESNIKGQPITSSNDNEIEVTSTVDTDLGLQFLLDAIQNGLAGSGGDAMASYDGATTLTIDVGPLTGPYCVIGDNLLKIISVMGFTYTVEPLISTGAASGAVSGGAPAYNNTQRNSLTGTQQPYLTALADEIKTRVSDWKTALNNQLTQLNANEDDRATQSAQITAAIADINAAISTINAWQALPDTGTLGNDSKFTDNNLLALENEISARASFASTRASEVTTALGTVTQSGDGSFSGSGVFLSRYEQLNNRINIIGGPLTEYYEKDNATSALAQLVQTKESQLDTYDDYIKVQELTSNGNDSAVIQVTDTSDFSPGQTVYVVSETQTELTGTILTIDSATQITLSFTVSSAYVLADRPRLYRVI